VRVAALNRTPRRVSNLCSGDVRAAVQPGLRPQNRSALRQEKLPTTSTLSFEQFTMLLPAAVAGLGVALTPALLVESELATKSLVCLFKPSVLTRPGQFHYLVYPTEKQDYPPVAAFREWLLMEVAVKSIR